MRRSTHNQLAAVACLLLVTACNEIPTAPEVVIVPSAPTSAEDLTVEVTTEATDNGRILFYRTTWTRDGSHVRIGTMSSLPGLPAQALRSSEGPRRSIL